ncbi:ATP-binding cassette domain-containing protein [Hufsiella ginkgonis]|uniref:ATP-binding cassette domain-containing protein n=1 Tax=Hufsiella ginkgonis TaxID=2695274 RepID=A0A7K1XYW8_9SPHI|nr:ATP-binding cassette domain-containing protein [Hufsiella ginkgonis]MXV16194.1 ATP-binding cassette domain-containing protein [Hufsiella ginkgonis]
MAEDLSFLSLEHITARAPGKVLFSDLSFELKKGEQWALVGPSGSGKSALLNAISGRLAMTGGKVSFHFYDRFRRSNGITDPLFNAAKLIAMVPQKHHFRNLSHTTEFYYQQRYNATDSENAATVAEHLAAVHAISPAEEPVWTADKVTGLFKLGQLLGKQVIKLSNGETRRLLFASALLRNPQLLLLDSPFTGLDSASRPAMDKIITEITRSGITVMVATSPAELPEAVTHVAVMDAGDIVSRGPKAVFDPASMSTAAGVMADIGELTALLALNPIPVFADIIAMNAISLRYDNVTVLDNISWHVRQGDAWALLGPNGAGKSSLLSLITGDNPQAYANDIILFDRKRGTGESIWDIKKRIGYVSPEMLQYFPSGSTCVQVTESGFYDTQGLFRPSNAAYRALCVRWMKILEIEEAANQPFNKVSASVQRLCLLARALVKTPVLLVLDEPCQGLDEHQQLHFKNLVDVICRLSNITLIYVTHYPGELPNAVTKYLKLEKGKVIDS